jgi:hypothetical protein
MRAEMAVKNNPIALVYNHVGARGGTARLQLRRLTAMACAGCTEAAAARLQVWCAAARASNPEPTKQHRTRYPGRVISDCHPSEGASKNRTQIPIIHRFYLFSVPSSLG